MIETNFTPFPVLTTERLNLRALEPSDDTLIYAHRSDDKVNTYLEGFRHTSLEQTQEFITRVRKENAEGKSILWVLTEKGQDKFIGTVCLWNISRDECKGDIGYTLDPAHHGKGYMDEALKEIIDFGFHKMKLKSIEAYTVERNSPSIRLLQKNRFLQIPATAEAKANREIVFSLSRNNVS